jgi:hypothetical protein
MIDIIHFHLRNTSHSPPLGAPPSKIKVFDLGLNQFDEAKESQDSPEGMGMELLIKNSSRQTFMRIRQQTGTSG